MNLLKQYRREQWDKSPSCAIAFMSDLEFYEEHRKRSDPETERPSPNTSCTSCLEYSDLRLTPSGVYCFNCYLSLPACEICLEPLLVTYRRPSDTYPPIESTLCRDHWQRKLDEKQDDGWLFKAMSASPERSTGIGVGREDMPKVNQVVKPCSGMVHRFASGSRVCQCGARVVGERKERKFSTLFG